MTDLLTLSRRVSEAEGPSRELDAEIRRINSDLSEVRDRIALARPHHNIRRLLMQKSELEDKLYRSSVARAALLAIHERNKSDD